MHGRDLNWKVLALTNNNDLVTSYTEGYQYINVTHPLEQYVCESYTTTL